VGKREAVITDYVVADGNRRLSLHHRAGASPDEAGQLRSRRAGHSSVILRRDRCGGPKGSGKAGNICIRNPWPGIMQTIWGDRDRYIKTYFAKYNKIPRARTGATGPSCAAMEPSRRPTATTASWAASMT